MIKKTVVRIVRNSIFEKRIKLTVAKIIVKLVNSIKVENADFTHFGFFELWQKNGFFIIPNNFYQSIPDTSKINKINLKKELSLVGINMNEGEQLTLLKNNFPKFKKEYRNIHCSGDPQGCIYYFNNSAFDGVDGLVYYCMIRDFNPKKIIEVGSGWSTKIAAQAALLNGNTELISIEPYPQPFMQKLFPGLSKVIVNKVENIPIKFFDSLSSSDILFIDSSHTVKTGGDVNYLFLEILPRLKKGVIIHIHDIFFPFDYPPDWVLKEHRSWAEQYLLQAFLMFNHSYKILYSNSYMGYKHLKEVKNVFPNSPFYKGGSIWIQKIK